MGKLNWIDVLFFGVRRIFGAGVEMPERPAVNFVNAAVTDNPAENRLEVDCGSASVPLTRTITAGAGLTGGGDLTQDRTLSVAALDPSMDVQPDGIRIGVLQTDAQHGSRGGGALHANATNLTAGFMSPADKAKLDAATSDATPDTLVLRRADGSADFGDYVEADAFLLAHDVDQERVGQETPVAASGWSPAAAGRWTNTTLGATLQVPLRVPHGATLREVHVRIDPADGHAALPANKLRVEVRVYDATTGSDDMLAATTDPAATIGAYEAAHTITVEVDATVDTATKRYRVDLIAESGANAMTGATYLHAARSWTRPEGSPVGLD